MEVPQVEVMGGAGDIVVDDGFLSAHTALMDLSLNSIQFATTETGASSVT